MTTLILCPLASETSLLLKSFSEKGYNFESVPEIEKLDVYFNSNLSMYISVGGHGKVQFAVHTQYLLNELKNKIDLVICTGAAGGLSAKTAVGDIVVATEILEHDYLYHFEHQPLPKFKTHFEKFADPSTSTKDLKIHFGIIASGDQDIIHPERSRELHEQTNALCVAWEGAGVAKVCRFYEIPFIEIRAITDKADDDAAIHFANNLEVGMNNLCSFFVEEVRVN